MNLESHAKCGQSLMKDEWNKKQQEIAAKNEDKHYIEMLERDNIANARRIREQAEEMERYKDAARALSRQAYYDERTGSIKSYGGLASGAYGGSCTVAASPSYSISCSPSSTYINNAASGYVTNSGSYLTSY